MKDLLKSKHDFEKNKTFTGSFTGNESDGLLIFTDVNGDEVLIPQTKHTSKAVSKIVAGDVVMIESTVKGFDVYQLDAGEIEVWKTTKKI